LTAFMRAPRTYTREDVVEIQAHGSPLTLQRILALALAAGARMARPGELTMRAFLNGRIDLAQAEAVMDLVNADSEAARRLALRQLQGELSERTAAIHQSALSALVRIEASIDFPEEEVPEPDVAEIRGLLMEATDATAALLAGAALGRAQREGLRVAIVGRPNVGKSSLLNALLGVERAIVTPVAGTTRDTIEETTRLRDIALRLVDTAGLTETEDPIERLGVERSRAAARAADCLTLVLDGSEKLTPLDYAAADELRALLGETPVPVILALNKDDLPAALTAVAAQTLWPSAPLVRVSAKTHDGVAPLEKALVALALSGAGHEADPLVASARHVHALHRVKESLAAAREALERATPLDFVALDIRAALEALGEVTGATATEDLLDQIFATFCIGK
jgi:tRNA modification GTPase